MRDTKSSFNNLNEDAKDAAMIRQFAMWLEPFMFAEWNVKQRDQRPFYKAIMEHAQQEPMNVLNAIRNGYESVK